MALTPIRRVVTGNDAQGRSTVVWDGPAPNTHENEPGSGRGWTDFWVVDEFPAPLSGDSDDGNKTYPFPAERNGAHFRIIHGQKRPENYDPANDPRAVAPHETRKRETGQAWDRGGNSASSTAIHKTESVDYGIVLSGKRNLVLDDRELVMDQGDIVVQLGNWHQWTSPDSDCRMFFVLIGGDFEMEGAQGKPVAAVAPPSGVRPVRRIVTIDKDDGTSTALADGPSPDVRTDPVRPGFAATRVWVTDSTPAKLKGINESLDMPHTIEPPDGGSICRVLTIPPDEGWKGKVEEKEVRAYFEAMGSPGASTYSPDAPHPYMQKTRSLDFCLVLEGEVSLVLDTQEVPLQAEDVAVIRGANHAFSNRSNRPAVVAISSHDGRY